MAVQKIKCTDCGEIVESEYVGHFACCGCYDSRKGLGCAIDDLGFGYYRVEGNFVWVDEDDEWAVFTRVYKTFRGLSWFLWQLSCSFDGGWRGERLCTREMQSALGRGLHTRITYGSRMSPKRPDCGHKKRELIAIALESAVFAVVFCTVLILTLEFVGCCY